MRRKSSIFLLALALAAPALASTDESPAPPVSCGNGVPGGVNCILSKKDLKQARTAFARGLKLRDHKEFEAAFAQFDEAARLVPQNPQFLSAREMVKAKLVFDHVERGNLLLLEDSRPQAAAEFQQALNLDPDNQFARDRLGEASRMPARFVWSPEKILPPSTTPARSVCSSPNWPRPTASLPCSMTPHPTGRSHSTWTMWTSSPP
jgi:tetratricopeptide (TPR) repeat protein